MAMMATGRRKTARIGRPPVGRNGEKVSGYPQVMIRLPRETKATLDALSGLTGTPIWRLIDQAIAVYVERMPEPQRKLLAGVRERRAIERRVSAR
jgi:predicted transcriptional regulator